MENALLLPLGFGRCLNPKRRKKEKRNHYFIVNICHIKTEYNKPRPKNIYQKSAPTTTHRINSSGCCMLYTGFFARLAMNIRLTSGSYLTNKLLVTYNRHTFDHGNHFTKFLSETAIFFSFSLSLLTWLAPEQKFKSPWADSWVNGNSKRVR